MAVPRWCQAAVAVVLVVARVASADPAAEQLFRDGKQLVKDGEIDAACERFQASEAQEPKVGTLLNLADCRERQGKLASAWELFLEAKALAVRLHDDRVDYAGQRAAAVEGRRAHLIVSVPADRRVTGLIVTRNGAPVAAPLWDLDAPIDPGAYTIEAKAPGYRPVQVRVVVAAEGRATATVPALEIDPAARAHADRVVKRDAEVRGSGVVAMPTTSPPIWQFSIGVAIGATTDSHSDTLYGVRATVGTPVGRGALRGIVTATYAFLHRTPTDVYDVAKLYAFGFGADYLFTWYPGLASAAGVGAGVDVTNPVYDVVGSTAWVAARVSPLIVRLPRPQLELGVHVMFVIPGNAVIGTLGLDWFFP